MQEAKKLRRLRGTCYYNKKIKVKNVDGSAKILTNAQTFRDCALHQWNVLSFMSVEGEAKKKKRWYHDVYFPLTFAKT